MNIYTYSPFVLSMLVSAGCSTHHFDRNERFSSAGSDYTVSVSELLKETQSKIIEVNTKLLLVSPRPTKEGRRKALQEQNASVASLIDKIDEYRRHNDLLGRYFKELEIASNAGKETEIGITLGELSHTIANLNQETAVKYGMPIPARMSHNQMGHVQSIADQLVKTHYAKKIQRQLVRDSSIIATQLYLQGKQLDNLIDLMQSALKEGRIMHLKYEVMEPYVKGDFDGRSFQHWPEARKTWFELRRTEDVFKAVKEAQQAMSWAWQDIIRGKRDISSVNSVLKDSNDFVRAISSFKTNTPGTDNSRILIQKP